MIDYREALNILEEIARKHPYSEERIGLNESLGRILSESVLSHEEVPSFTNSAMDGFAVFSADTVRATSTHPVRIAVKGMVAAGDLKAFAQARANGPGQSVEIMTGAPLPEGGYDAVVRIEDVRVERSPSGDAIGIDLVKPLQAGENIRLKGTDFGIGHPVLRAGMRIAPEHILACASLGISQLKVKSMPRVAVISTGSELVDPSEPTLAPGMIRNSTGPFLVAALKEMGAEARYWGVIHDDPGLYQKTLERALQAGADLIISTGAVSMGKFDFVPEVLGRMGAKTYFHKAAIRPGKPVLFAEMSALHKGCVFFGVPGNPVSTAVGLRFFVEPFVRAALGLEREEPIRARLVRDSSKPNGLRCFFKGRSRLGKEGVEVETLKGQASYIVSALLDANCWVVFPEAGDRISAQDAVDIYPLHHSFDRGVL